jgi:hypothetical protein
MTGKTKWTGLVDDRGIPVCQLLDGSSCHFITTIVQKALGHCDRYFLTSDNGELEEFIKICEWLVDKQDKNGGWEVASVIHLKGHSNYSAMSQGEAVSALVRAWKHTHRSEFLESAKKAYDLLIKPVQNGGTAYVKDDDFIFEEYPTIDRNTILNGWIFGLFGVYDYSLATGEANDIFNRSFNTLRRDLHLYDTGYWSFYDAKGTMIASPFYHQLHISQLEALYSVTKDNILKIYIEQWKKYENSSFKKGKAVFVKIFQKLKNPGDVVFVR